MNGLCFGGWGYGNLGDEFILRGTLAGINAAFPDANITAASFTPEQTSLWHNVATTPSLHRLYVGKNPRYINKVGIGRAWLSFYLTRWTRHTCLREIAKKMCSSYELVVQAGGGYFNDYFWEAFPGFSLELLG